MDLLRRCLAVTLLLALVGCKIIQTVPQGGYISSRTGANDCLEGQVCIVDIADGSAFSDTFEAIPREGYYFDSWKRAPGHICGGSTVACGLENIPGAFTNFDIDLYLEPVFRQGMAPLQQEQVDWQRHVDFNARLSLFYPSHLQRSISSSPEALIAFVELPQSGSDDFLESISLIRTSSPSIDVGSEGTAQLLSQQATPVGDKIGTEAIYNLTLDSLPGKLLQAQFIYIEVGGQYYGLLHLAERSQFRRYSELTQIMAETLSVGQIAMDGLNENSDLTQPGRPAVATDGRDFLTVSCRGTEGGASANLYGSLSHSDDTFGAEFIVAEQVDTFNTGCTFLSPRLVFDGSNYLLVYGGVVNGLSSVLGQRISPTGKLLDDSPFQISGNYPSHSHSPAVVFDGSRSFVVWAREQERELESGYSKYSIMGALVEQGGASEPRVIHDDLSELYNFLEPRGQLFTPEVTTNGSGYFVVWNKYYHGDTLDSRGRPLYGQTLDLAGAPLAPAPLLIRDDEGANNPRYADVTSNGDDYLVGWIEGKLETNLFFVGDGAVLGQLVSRTGQLKELAQQTPRVLADVAEPEIPGQPSKDFLDLSFDGKRFVAVWSAVDLADRGLYSVDISQDLASVSLAYSISGVQGDDPFVRPVQTRQVDVAHTGTESLVVWSAGGLLQAWRFGNAQGMASRAAAFLPRAPTVAPTPRGTAPLNRAEVPRVHTAFRQAVGLGKTLARALRLSEYLDNTPGAQIDYCYFGGSFSFTRPQRKGVVSLDFTECGVAPGLEIQGTLIIPTAERSGNYQTRTRLSLSDLSATRNRAPSEMSGTIDVYLAPLRLAPDQIELNVTLGGEIPALDMQLRDFRFAVEDVFLPTLEDIHGFSGVLALDRGVFNLGNSVDGRGALLRGASADATYVISETYTELGYLSADAEASVRVPNTALNAGEIDLLAVGAEPRAASRDESRELGVDEEFLNATVASWILTGVTREILASGLFTHSNGIPLTYTAEFVRATKTLASAPPPVENPVFFLDGSEGGRFEFSATTGGFYTIALEARDALGNVSERREITFGVELDSDGDSIADNRDIDDDNDGVMDSDDDFPTDARYVSDRDGDGIPDALETDLDTDGVDDVDDYYPLNPNCFSEFDGDADGCYSEIAGRRLKREVNGKVYFFEYENPQVLVWDLETGSFVQPLDVGTYDANGAGPTGSVVVENHGRIYLAYNSGLVTYIDFDDTSVEQVFTHLSSRVSRLYNGVNFLIAKTVSGPENVKVFDQAGQQVSQARGGFEPVYNAYAYSAAEGVFYDAFEEGDFDISTGQIVPEQEKLPGMPVVSSPDGNYSVREQFIGAPFIIDVRTGEVTAQLDFPVNHELSFAWTDRGLIYGFRGNYYRLNERAEILETYEIPSGDTQVFEHAGVLYISTGGSSAIEPLRIAAYEASDDTDGDGVSNLLDRFPNNSVASLDDDRDGYPDAWSPGVVDSGGSGLALDAYPGEPDCYLAEHGIDGYCSPAQTIAGTLYFPGLLKPSANGIVYSLAADGRIHRYSLEQDVYLSSLRLSSGNPYKDIDYGSAIVAATLSADEDSLYLAYSGLEPRITRVSLEDPLGAESEFANLSVEPGYLEATDRYIVLATRSFLSNKLFFDDNGELVGTSMEPSWPDSLHWDPIQKMLYSTKFNGGVYQELLGGLAIPESASQLSDVKGPIYISRDGERFSAGRGQVYRTLDGSPVATLSGEWLSRDAWLENGQFARISFLGPDKVQLYDQDLQLIFEEDSPHGIGVAVFEHGGELIVVAKKDSIAPLEYLRFKLP